MKEYIVQILGRKEIAENTDAFILEKPKGYEFKAGQYMNVGLFDKGNTTKIIMDSPFSVASAPYEKNLMLATRIREGSSLKQLLDEYKEGDKLQISAPKGQFVLPESTERPIVYLVGGIGITPVRSILLQSIHTESPHNLYVFYSNRRPEDTAFLAELQEISETIERISVIFTMTEDSDWEGELGYIDKDMLMRHMPDITVPMHYIVGSPSFVEAIIDMLKNADIDEFSMRTEDFSGYD